MRAVVFALGSSGMGDKILGPPADIKDNIFPVNGGTGIVNH
jgi:hypothetical protein